GMPSLVMPATRPPEFCEATTSDGLYFAIASMFGVRPDSVVFGTPAGWLESASTATTWLPAPTAYRSSVVVGDSETIRVGSLLIVTTPLPALTVTGKAAAADALPLAD